MIDVQAMLSRNIRERKHDPFGSIVANTSVVRGIDLRLEFARMIEEHGHWIILRKYDRTRRSRFWDEATQSAIGGPPWEYKDYMVKAMKSVRRASSTDEYGFRPGSVDLKSDTYYLSYELDPTLIDLLLEITPETGLRPEHYIVNQARDIYRVDPMRDAQGRVEYYTITLENAAPRGDATLK